MSLSQALSISLTGLRATQAGLSLVAGNVANAQTAGYIRKTISQQTTVAGDNGGGVTVSRINRVIDEFVQRQLRVETSGGSYASLRADMYSRLQQVYGEPGSDSAFETIFNNFTNAVQELTTSPDSSAARSMALSAGQVLAQYFNSVSNDIQALRGDAENGLAGAVESANSAMQQIASINTKLANAPPGDISTAILEDQRDRYVEQLSELMDIRVVAGDRNEYNVFTNSGVQLVGAQAAQLTFDPQGTVNASTVWDRDPSKRSLGTLMLTAANGSTVDLIANQAVRSGQIAAYIEMRDHILVEAQSQLDAMAGAMAKSLSSQTSQGTATSVPPQTGYEIDTTGLLAGNTINLTYTDSQSGQQRKVTIVRVDDPAALPFGSTTGTGDKVIGVDFSFGIIGVAAQLNAVFNGAIQFDNPTGDVLRVLDDGATNRTDISGMSMTRTVTGLAEGDSALPFFTDATGPYSAFPTSTGSQTVGFASRIAVNPLLLSDPAKLVKFSATTDTGDPQRPNFIYQQLTGTSYDFPANTGFGSNTVPYSSDLPTFLKQMLSTQGENAANAQALSQGQDVVVNALKARLADQSGVNVDQEMANLITLQTSYGANARVMSVVKDLIDILLKM